MTPSPGTKNNGDVWGYYYWDGMNPQNPMTHTATYLYDAVNRLYSAAATGNVAYSQAYTFTGDGSTGQYGNMGCAPAGPGCVAFTYNPANNQIAGYTYDPAGNLINDGTNTYQWDGEGHLTSVSNASGTVSTNIYNALGQRVRDVTPTSTTDEAYGAGGELLWRYTGNSNDPTQRAFVPFNGSILAEYWSGGTIFDHPDQIGTISTATDQTGNNFQERLYHPFGEFWTGANLDSLGVHQTFAKLPDYDPETDQYNTLNRHYSPSGRWLSPDPGGLKAVHTDDPQTWNMYAYVRNNPTTLTDPSGLYVCNGSADQCKTIKNALANVQQAADKLKAGSKEQKALEKVLKFYGAEGKKNGVTVAFGDLGGKAEANTGTTGFLGLFKNTTITFDLSQMGKSFGSRTGVNEDAEFAGITAHEGTHGIDQRVSGMPRTRDQYMNTETNAFTNQSYVNQGLGTNSAYGLWMTNWNPAQVEALRQSSIEENANNAVRVDLGDDDQ